LPWIIAGISIVVLVSLVILIRRKKEKREHSYYMYEHHSYWERYSIKQLEEEVSRIGRKKKELERRLEIFSKAAPKVILGDEDYSHYDDIESQMQDIRWQLEKLDREEDDKRKVLIDKKADKERATKKETLSTKGSTYTNKGEDLYYEVSLSQKEASTGIKKTIMYDRDKGKKRLIVTIPPGVKEGAKIRLKGMGLEGNPPGDLYLIVRTRM